MKRLLFSIVLLGLSGMVFAVSYPATPYRHADIYTYDNELVVPMDHQMRPTIKSVRVRSGARTVAEQGSFAMTVGVTSGGSLHSYGVASAPASSAKGTHTQSVTASSPIVSTIPAYSSMPNAKVKQLASTTYDSYDDPNITYRADGPPLIDEDDPNNPAIWVPIGDACIFMLMIALIYALLFISKRKTNLSQE